MLEVCSSNAVFAFFASWASAVTTMMTANRLAF